MADSNESNPTSDKSMFWRIASIVVNGLAVGIIAVMMLQFGTSEENSARVRNSLIVEIGQSEDFDWVPGNRPDSFVAESSAPPEQIASETRNLLSAAERQGLSELGKAKLFARHLASNRQAQSPIQSNTLDAYRQIVDNGDGYCADYSQVFTALALAGDVPVREWGLGWEGFGFGHTFNEIYDSSLDKWVFIDSFNSLYVVDVSTGIPLSVLEFQQRLREAPDDPRVKVIPLDWDKTYFKTQEQALEYYTRGADQFFMFWGNDVFSYDSNTYMKMLDGMPRSVEVMAAILLGIHPSIRVIETNTNAEHIDMLLGARQTLLTYFVLLFIGSGILVIQLWFYLRARRQL